MSQIALRDDPGQHDKRAMALRFHFMQIKIVAGFNRHLDLVVFKGSVRGPAEKDRKLRQKYQGALKTPDAYHVLALVWKESRFVTEDALTQSGILRAFKLKPLTAYGLACDLSESDADRPKMNSRIRTIMLAAEAYQLVEFEKSHATEKPIKGTVALDNLMLEHFRIFDEAVRDGN